MNLLLSVQWMTRVCQRAPKSICLNLINEMRQKCKLIQKWNDPFTFAFVQHQLLSFFVVHFFCLLSSLRFYSFALFTPFLNFSCKSVRLHFVIVHRLLDNADDDQMQNMYKLATIQTERKCIKSIRNQYKMLK